MKLDNTAKALLSRGIPSDFAQKLSKQGYTISKLKQMSKEDLLKIGLKECFIDLLYNEPRSKIDANIINKLLQESKFTCCVCREPKKPIVIHHIEPWEISRSHEEINLVVLCVEHHAEAHSTHELSLNLTKERIRFFKDKWREFVKESDKSVVSGLLASPHVYWDYFNRLRLFELFHENGIKTTNGDFFNELSLNGYINEDGILTPESTWPDYRHNRCYWLDCSAGRFVYQYVKSLVNELFSNVPIKVANHIWSKKEILALLKVGNFVAIQGAFYFKWLSKISEGTNQLRLAYRRADGIKFEFVFDAWESTSSSSWCYHLTQRRVVTAFVIVRSITSDSKNVVVSCSALAIGSYFNEISAGRGINLPYLHEHVEELDEEEVY